MRAKEAMMSGFAVARGPRAKEAVDRMMGRIGHRGPHLSGVYHRAEVALAQNYLRADCPDAPRADAIVPVAAPGGDLRICYDGEIGNVAELARSAGVAEGPFREERLLLQLYSERGAEMLELLDDAIFAFVIVDGDKLLAARDVFGIKTLFLGRANGTLCLTSELKSLAEVTDDVHEFPPGHRMDGSGETACFANVPEHPPELLTAPLEAIAAGVRDIIERSVRSRVNFARPTACLLSGGMDSSVISCVAAKLHRERFGPAERIKSFAIGTADSGDLASARIVAEHLRTDHEEVVIDLDALLEALPEVIYALESFDPSLVRSAASNFLISRHAARAGYEVLLSGEGGDELFCGYAHLKRVPPDELFPRQMDLFRYLHNNASLRLDRTNLANSVRVVAPLISGELFEYAIRIPPAYKLRQVNGRMVEKWIFRKAYEELLPRSITERVKQEFSQGSGAARLLPDHFKNACSDAELTRVQAEHPLVRNKEEMHYFHLFARHFGTGPAVQTVGQWAFK
jgi:asparagine synthase (glutamine-hydrolysing)